MTTSWLFGARVVRQTRRRASVSCDEEVLDSFGAGFVLDSCSQAGFSPACAISGFFPGLTAVDRYGLGIALDDIVRYETSVEDVGAVIVALAPFMLKCSGGER